MEGNDAARDDPVGKAEVRECGWRKVSVSSCCEGGSLVGGERLVRDVCKEAPCVCIHGEGRVEAAAVVSVVLVRVEAAQLALASRHAGRSVHVVDNRCNAGAVAKLCQAPNRSRCVSRGSKVCTHACGCEQHPRRERPEPLVHAREREQVVEPPERNPREHLTEDRCGDLRRRREGTSVSFIKHARRGCSRSHAPSLRSA